MKTQTAFCSACDRDVQIALPDEPVWEGQANLADPEIVCLEIGEKCTGHLCPVGAQPASVMKARLVRSGMELRLQPYVRGWCDGCGAESELVVIDKQYATCPTCGHTTARATLA